MQMHKPSASDYCNQHQNPDDFADQSDAKISLEFNRCLQLEKNDDSSSQNPLPDSAVHAGDEDEEGFVNCEDDEEDEGDFTFMYLGENNSPDPADKLSENGQIRQVFPLFDQKLLLSEGGNRFPIQPPADKVFVESNHRSPSSTSENDEIENIAAGPYCTWSKQPATANPDLGKKSNSTGFSKLWRLRDKVGRSNSDGRDAFVFLDNPGRSTASSKSVVKPTAIAESPATSNAAGRGKAKVVKQGTKAKKANLSAHEIYLRQREQSEEERRRSYMPYRPELVGFFTNVNGGLSRNVHPY